MENKTLKIGLDIHNLSTDKNTVVRTGIQNVVFQVLKHLPIIQKKYTNLSFVLLPFFPENSSTSFLNILPIQDNNSMLVLEESFLEIGEDINNHFDQEDVKTKRVLTEGYFYEKTKDIDWLIILSLLDARNIIHTIKRYNPTIKIAILVYDIIPYLYTEFTAEKMSEWFTQSYIPSIQFSSDILFTISYNTGLDLLNHINFLLPSSVPIISTSLPPESVNGKNMVENRTNILEKWNVLPKTYFVSLATIEPRKNLQAVVCGFLRFKELFPQDSKNSKLVLIGKAGWKQEDKKIYQFVQGNSSIIVTGYLPEEEKNILIENSLGLYFLSKYEGYGLPLSLAQSLNIPTVTCNNSSLPEAVEGNSIFVSPNSIDEISLSFFQLIHKNYSLKPMDNSYNWLSFLTAILDTIQNHNYQVYPTNFYYQPTTKKKILIDFHNLSILNHQIQKTGIQETVFSLLKESVDIRKRYKNIELLGLPNILNSWNFVPNFSPTLNHPPEIFKKIEEELGYPSTDIWGFDFKKYKYQFDNTLFTKLSENISWFLLTSQFDIRRILAEIKRNSPNLQIAHIVYDLIPNLFPEFVPHTIYQWYTTDYINSVLKYTNMAFPISRSASLDLCNFAGKEPFSFESISVYEKQFSSNIDHSHQVSLPQNIVETIKNKKILLHIGNTDPRKNTVNLLKGFSRFLELYSDKKDVVLLVIGPKHFHSSKMMKLVNETVLLTGYLSDDQLNQLIKNSHGVLMPSRYEGYGIPLAHAKRCGTPTLSTKISSLPEVAGEHCVYVEPYSVDSIALGIKELLEIKKFQPVIEPQLGYLETMINCMLSQKKIAADIADWADKH